MTEVAKKQIKVGDNFPPKKIMSLWFAEGAIQVSKYIVFCNSDTDHLSAVGDKFEYVSIKKDDCGWVVSCIHIVVRILNQETKLGNFKSQAHLCMQLG